MTAGIDNIFDLDELVARLRVAAENTAAVEEIASILQQVVDDADRVDQDMPVFRDNDVVLFEDNTISIWHCRSESGYSVPAYDHQMEAVIGVYKGAERNRLYRPDGDGYLTMHREITLSAGDMLHIMPNDIHAVSCVSVDACCGLHVYLGCLTEVKRSLSNLEKGAQMTFTDDKYHRLTT